MSVGHGRRYGAGAALLLLAAGAGAQVNNAWASFTRLPAKLAVAPLSLSDAGTQAVLRTADLDQDGWEDVVVVRASQGAQLVPKANVLLMNLTGVLTDRTAQYATASDVPGDLGFATPTNDRDVVIGDVNGDTWLDVVTCASLGDGLSKQLSHPRVYINLGDDLAGNWLGLRHEDARIPQLFTVGGLPVAPRFSALDLADLTGDGAPDLYFVDHDGTASGVPEAAGADLNDRLLVNDGSGFFTDQSALRLTPAQLLSSFGADVTIVDLNADGHMDIVKASTLSSPVVVRAIYNNPANVGNFTAMGSSDFGTGTPYGMAFGDLNHDEFLDAVITDGAADRYRFGVDYDVLHRMIWSPPKSFGFVTGTDDGVGRHVYIRDLDADGWNDVLVTDVDGDLPGCNRRLHIYQNLGTTPADFSLVLKEESEFANGSTGAGWKGVVGMTAADAKGSYDVGFGDFDRDGDLDLLLATCSGTNYWRNNTTSIPQTCQANLGFGGPGSMELSLCGDDLTYAGSSAVLGVVGAAPSVALSVVIGLAANPIPFKGGLLVPFPFLAIIGGLPSDGAGSLALPISGGAAGSVHLIMQVAAKNGPAIALSNALDVELGF